MSVAYGIEATERKDMYLDIVETALLGLQNAARPGAYLVDFLPIREIRSVCFVLA